MTTPPSGPAPVPREGAAAGQGAGAFPVLDVVDRVVALLCKSVIVATGVALTTVMTANVVARYALSTGGFRWAQELPTMLFPWFIVAGIILAAQGGAHMAVEWLSDKLAERGKVILFVFGQVCVVLSFVVLCKESIWVAGIAGAEHSPVLGLPNSIGYYAVASGAALVALVTAIAAWRVLRLGWEARPQARTEEMPL